MEAFSPIPPEWVDDAKHALTFSCPRCGEPASVATDVWINRRAPVYTHSHKRKWQEFYRCECGTAWWAWSSDRPPNPWQINDAPDDPSNDLPEETPSNLDPLTGLGDGWDSFEP